MNTRAHAVLFDLDGTLIDHFNVLYRSCGTALTELSLPVPDFETFKRSVGGSMAVTMGHYVGEDQMEEALRIWLRQFDNILLEDVTMLPGARELMEALNKRGHTQAVFTNKVGEQSRRIVTHLGLDSMVEYVLGANDTPYCKPDAAFSREALARLPGGDSQAIFIGDSPYDIQSAHCVSRPAYCVATGTHTEEELVEAGAEGVFLNMWELGREVFSINFEPAGEVA